MAANINQLQLYRYLPFWGETELSHSALGLYADNGQIIIEAVSDGLIKQGDFNLDQFVHVSRDKTTYRPTEYQLIEHQHHVFSCLLTIADSRIWLVGYWQSERTFSADKINELTRTLNQIAICLLEDYEQLEKITVLSDKYNVCREELDLLHGIEEIEPFYNNSDEKTSLERIARSCIDYLNVDYAAICLPRRQFFLGLSAKPEAEEKYQQLERLIRLQLCGQFLNISKALTLNRGNEAVKTSDKLLIVPISQCNRSACGLLVLVNYPEKPDFNENDQRMARTLASEASKIIQIRRDPTTEQLNRRGFTEILASSLTEQATNIRHSLLVIDLDHFKVINEVAGKAGGDLLLKQITIVILKKLKNTDVLGRLGSDEFAILLKQCRLNDAVNIAERIRLAIEQFKFIYQGKAYEISACLGVVELDEQIKDASQALKLADLACTVAKGQGRNRIHIYNEKDQSRLSHPYQIQWLTRIHTALSENQFVLYRQKIASLQGGEDDSHYEILIRLQDGAGRIYSPEHFLPVAEHYHLMPQIDQWVITRTLQKMAECIASQSDCNIRCSINLSGQSVDEKEFCWFIQQQIKHYQIPAESLCFEITETVAVSNLMQAATFMEEIKAMGCQFSLDDFGSGMSSFTYLKNLPVDYVKIDGAFVKNILQDQVDKAMVKAIHQIGNVMGLKTIAEFIENEEIKKELTAIGVDYGQGNIIGTAEVF